MIIIDFIPHKSVTNGIKLSAKVTVGDLDFADDITMLQLCKQRLQEHLNRVSEKASQLGLRINSSKTKTIATTYSPFYIRCGSKEIEQVVEFEYLGSIVKNKGSISKEITTRIGRANAAFNGLKRI